jgi:hypothetical protein
MGLVLMVLAPPVLGLVLGLLQLLGYAVLVKAGRTTWDAVPFFPILWLRGMVVVVAVGAILGIVQALGRPN